MNEHPIHVVLAKAHGLRRFLAASGGISVVAEARDSPQVFAAVLQGRSDVVVLDDQFADRRCNCLGIIQRLRADGYTIGILVVMSSDDAPSIKAAIEAGANGYVLKSSAGSEIVEAVHAVYDASCVVAQLQRKRPDTRR